MITLNTTLDKFITDNYDKIVHMARKIIKSSDRHVYEELAHHALESFIKHERAEELIEKKQAIDSAYFQANRIADMANQKADLWENLIKEQQKENI